MRRLQNIYTVVSNTPLSPRFFHLILDGGERPAVRPGQFIHIRISDGLEPFFRRPFSIYRAQKHLEIFYEPVGLGTRRLTAKVPGERLDILGPLGTGFALPPEGTRQVVMIAGGIGVAPFMALSDELKGKGYELLLLYGGRSGEHVFDMQAFEDNGCRVAVATDDGSFGVKGRVSALFDQIRVDPATTFLYTCGPNPMMAAVQAFAAGKGLRGQVSCEEVMACGLGACLGCSIPTEDGYRTVCHEGPVFDLSTVRFDQIRH